jgi:hypothetical protein
LIPPQRWWESCRPRAEGGDPHRRLSPRLDIVRERGIERRSIIRRAGMNPTIFDDPDNVVPYVELCRLVQLTTEATHCEHLGVLAGALDDCLTRALRAACA